MSHTFLTLIKIFKNCSLGLIILFSRLSYSNDYINPDLMETDQFKNPNFETAIRSSALILTGIKELSKSPGRYISLFEVDDNLYRFSSPQRDFYSSFGDNFPETVEMSHLHFAKQSIISYSCSGCLVAKDKVITARHCFDKSITKRIRVAFDYDRQSDINQNLQFNYSNLIQPTISFPSNRFYKVKSISELNELDIVILNLEKEVKDRSPVQILNLSEKAKNSNFGQVYAIHYPYGLPQKISKGNILLYDSIDNNVNNFTNLRYKQGVGFNASYLATSGSSGACIFNEDGRLISIHYGRSEFYIKKIGSLVETIQVNPKNHLKEIANYGFFSSYIIKQKPRSIYEIPYVMYTSSDIESGLFQPSSSIFIPKNLIELLDLQIKF